jgi:hypothetical protein
MKLRCAAYARYSSDRQSPASVQDQLRTCRELADQQNWVFLDGHVGRRSCFRRGLGSDRIPAADTVRCA